MELLLLVDVSGSIDSAEYAIQKQGYVDAFNDLGIATTIAGKPGGVAVAFAEWSGGSQQNMLVPWTLLDSVQDSYNFGAAIDGTTRAFSGGNTAPGSAINWGVNNDPNGILNNCYNGLFKVIDISGDGSKNDGANTFNAATNAWGAPNFIRVNGLAILGESGLAAWYEANITTPGHGTLWTVNGLSEQARFTEAVKIKIHTEIQDPTVPEPGTWAMLAGGLALLLAGRRKFQK